MAAKLRTNDIDQATLIQYLDTKSDFHFELKVLKMLRDFGLPCEHGGHYTDPVTKKSREFDIRCRVSAGTLRVQLALECKNLQRYNPLLVTAVSRPSAESYHFVARVRDRSLDWNWGDIRIMPGFSSLAPPNPLQEAQLPKAVAHVLPSPHAMYTAGEPVGKSTTQVAITASREPEMLIGDSEVYEKWGQCLNSLADMIGEIEDMPVHAGCPEILASAVPVLVVPDGTLWRTIYADDGARREDPCQVDRTSIYVGKNYSLGLLNRNDFIVSHVEIMTMSGLASFIQQSLSTEDGIVETFFRIHPDDLLAAAFEHR